MKIAVVLHLYYFDMIDEIVDYLSNFRDIDYDLFVTTDKIFKIGASATLAKLKNIKQVFYMDNFGYDLWPFCVALKEIEKGDYDLLFKIHTKRTMANIFYLNKVKLYGDKWRKYLMEPIMGSHEKIKSLINIFSDKNNIGMAGSKNLLVRGKSKMSIDIDINAIHNTMEKLKLKPKKYEFIAGTMFVARPGLFKPLLEANFDYTDFIQAKNENKFNSLAFCLERCLGMAVSSQNYKILPLENS